MLVIAGWEIAMDDAVDSWSVECALNQHFKEDPTYPDTWRDGEWVVIFVPTRHLCVGRVFPIQFSIDALEWVEFAGRIAQVLGTKWEVADKSVLYKYGMLLSAPSVFVVDFLLRHAFGKVAHIYGVKINGWPNGDKDEEIPEEAKRTQLLGWIMYDKLSYDNFIARVTQGTLSIEQHGSYSLYEYAGGIVVDNHRVKVGRKLYAECYFGIPWGDDIERTAQKLSYLIKSIGSVVRLNTKMHDGLAFMRKRGEIVLSKPALIVQQSVGDPVGIPCALARPLAEEVLARVKAGGVGDS